MQPDSLDTLYASPKESWVKKFGARILAGILCSAFVYFLMHLGVVVFILQWTCEIGRRALGRPGAAVKLDALESKADSLIEKGKQVAKERHGDGLIHKALAPVTGPVREVMEAKKTVENVAAKVDAVRETAKQGAEAVKETGGKLADAIGGAGASAKAALGALAAGFAARSKAKAVTDEKRKREILEAHAAVIGFKTDPEWTLPRLQGEVLKAELAWNAKHGANCQCPQCHNTMRVSTKGSGERIRCSKCGLIFPARTGRQVYASNHQNSIHLKMR